MHRRWTTVHLTGAKEARVPDQRRHKRPSLIVAHVSMLLEFCERLASKDDKRTHQIPFQLRVLFENGPEYFSWNYIIGMTHRECI
jgi:hypothetical protein